MLLGLLLGVPLSVQGQSRYAPQGPGARYFQRGEAALTQAAIRVERGDEDAARAKYKEAIRAFEGAIEAEPKYVDAYVKLGWVYYTLGEFGPAIPWLERGLEPIPNHPDLRYWLGTHLLRAGRTAEALPHLEHVATATDDHPEVHVVLGTYYYKARDYENARLAFERHLRVEPDDVAVRGMLGNAYFKLKQYAPALTAFQAVKRRDPDNLAVDVNMGNAHFKLGQYEQAVTLLARVLQQDPTRQSVRFNLAQSYFQLERYPQALAYYDRFLEHEPRSFKGRYFRGRTLIKLGHDDEALVELAKATELNPKQAPPLYQAGLIHLRAKRSPEAGDFLERARALDADDPWILTALGSVARQSGQLGRAEQLQRAAIEQAPNQPRLHGNLALTQHQAGHTLAAKIALEQALELDHQDPWLQQLAATVLAALAKKTLRQGDLAGAETHLRRALSLWPDDPQLQTDLALIEVAKDKRQAALIAARRSVRARPHAFGAQYALARALLLAEQPQEAASMLARASAQRPSAEIAIARGAALISAGETEAAVKVLDATIAAHALTPALRVNHALAHLDRALIAVQQPGAHDPQLRQDLAIALQATPLLSAADAARAHYAAWIVALRRRDSRAAQSHQAKLEAHQIHARNEPVIADAAGPNHLDYLRALTESIQSRHDRVITNLEGRSARRRAGTPSAHLLGRTHILLARQAFTQNDLDVAARHFRAAGKINRHPAIDHNLAVIALLEGNIRNAERGLKAVSKQVPEATFNLGLVAEARGQHRRAADLFERVATQGGALAEPAREIAQRKQRIFRFR